MKSLLFIPLVVLGMFIRERIRRFLKRNLY